MRHGEVAGRIAGWHATLVAPKKLYFAPVDAVVKARCEQRIGLSRSISASETEGEFSVCADRIACQMGYFFRRTDVKRLSAVEHDYLLVTHLITALVTCADRRRS